MVRTESEAIYQELLGAGIDVALDDRDERPGAMFADWELIGVPVRVTVGERSLKEGQLELLQRKGMVASTCARNEVVQQVQTLLKEI
jgi:prolyl-tRNA synthetase